LSNLYLPTLKLTLSPWQGNVWKDSSRFIVVNAGRRAGKTYMVAWKLIDFATKNKGSIVWYVAPTYKQAKNILWEQMTHILPPPSIEKKNETELKIVLINGSQILVKGAEDPDSLRGVRIDFCVFDECAFIDKWEEVWKVMRPTLIDSRAHCWFISTPNGFNHFKQLADAYKTDNSYSYHTATSWDNPHLSKDELEQVKKESINDPDKVDGYFQEIMGEFRKMSGLIYKNFDRKIHMIDLPDIQFNHTFFRSLDFGFGHKTALLYFAVNMSGNEIYVYDGLYQQGLTEKDIAEIVRIKDAERFITNAIADSAAPMSIAELANYGVFFAPVEKGQDSVKHGIAAVAELLKIRPDTGRPTLMINKNLTWIADEFERYRWVETKQDSVIRDIPYKVNDDAMDAIRYFAMTYKKERDVTNSNNFDDWKI
jgi:PBSX family phage terminase large subunit